MFLVPARRSAATPGVGGSRRIKRVDVKIQHTSESTRARTTSSSSTTTASGGAQTSELEFGGSLTVGAIMVFSHFVIYWVFLSVACNRGRPFPLPTDDVALREMWRVLRETATPTPAVVAAYLSYLTALAALALVCPGPTVYGYPIPASKKRKVSSCDDDDDDDDDEKDHDGRGQKNQKSTTTEAEKMKTTAATLTTTTSTTTIRDGGDVSESVRNVRLPYRCNALAAWWVILLTVAAITAACGDAPLVWIADNWGRLLTCAVVVADATSVVAYLHAVVGGRAERMTGKPLYDFFMGAELNPRAFGDRLDMKMWSELRTSWVTLFLLTLSAAAKQRRMRSSFDAVLRRGDDDYLNNHHHHRHVSGASWVMLVAHWVYANACQKGEESVPYTWDIFHEKWGWMLIFWNIAGVPFLYCANSFFIAERDVILSQTTTACLLATLISAYYVWDTSQSQRTRFRMKVQGLYVERPWAFPVLPWGTLRSPKSMATARGDPLLISGWVGWARKIHYTADAVMACIWALACTLGSTSPMLRDPLPFLYPVFFLVMIVHRVGRDEKRCRKKYGRDWRRYRAAVPYCWIPGIV